MTAYGIDIVSCSPVENICFVGSELKRRLLSSCESEGWMPVCVEIPGAQCRGRLGLILEEAIERCLDARGACPPGISASADSDASLSDQLYRARLLGAQGLALAIERLECIANRAGALDAEDSAVLRWWVMTARERPLRLYFDARDESLGIYSAPTRFGQLVQESRGDEPPSCAPPVNEELASNLLNMQGTSDYVVQNDAPASTIEPLDHLPSSVDSTSNESSSIEPTHAEAECAVTTIDSEAPDCSDVMSEAADPESDEPVAEGPNPAAVVSTLARPPLHPDAGQRWPEWMRALDQARGPRPLALVEQLFVNAYVPLVDAAARGLTGPEAFDVLGTWSTSFARSYSEAFDALRLRGKRPMMVLDVVDVSLRLARLHGARSVQLVLVDGMRFDLGLRIEEQMRTALNRQASMTERLLLWSALPSTTAAQLELIARGPDGLKDFAPPTDSSAFVAHGRAASTLRRVKAGNREVLKLDLVEARLNEPGMGSPDRLDALADEVSQILSSALVKLAPRTLAVVFGDHGFWIDPKAGSSATVRHGGASPDEILVPAFAWLVGATH
jgi:hypothetical protein